MNYDEKRSDITKYKIIASAKSEFAEMGYNNASMSSIAEKAGVNHASLFYHFKNKEYLFRSIIMNSIESVDFESLSSMKTRVEHLNRYSEEVLSVIADNLVDIYFSIGDKEIRKMLSWIVVERDGPLYNFTAGITEKILKDVELIINDGITNGIFAISDSRMFICAVLSFIMNYPYVENFLFEDSENKIREMFTRFLRELFIKVLKPDYNKIVV